MVDVGRRRATLVVGLATALVGLGAGVAMAATFSNGSPGKLVMNAGDSVHATCPNALSVGNKVASAVDLTCAPNPVTTTTTVASTTTTVPVTTTTVSRPPLGWPDASNTGWQPTGVSLAPVSQAVIDAQVGTGKATWDGTNLIFTASGTVASPLVLDSLDIPGRVAISGQSYWTVRRSKIHAHGDQDSAYAHSVVSNATGLSESTVGVTFADDEIYIDALSSTGAYAAAEPIGATLLRVNMHDVVQGVYYDDWAASQTVQDSWIHNLINPSGSSHDDGIFFFGAVSNVTLRHNRIQNSLTQTDSIIFSIHQALPNGYGVDNITVDNNLLSAGACAISYYGGTGGSSPVGAIKVTNNQWSAEYGGGTPVLYVQSPGATPGSPGYGSTWSGNTWADGPNVGKPIPAA